MKDLFLKWLYRIFKDRIEQMVKDRMDDVVVEQYIDQHFFIRNGLDLKFTGEKLIQLMGASFSEMLKDTENYVVCDLEAQGFTPMEITIKRKDKLSPHEKAEKLFKENEELKKQLFGLRLEFSRARVSGHGC